MDLAEHLGKFRYEVLAMPCSEISYWMAYFKIKNHEAKRQQQKQDQRTRVRNKTPRGIRKLRR